MLALSLLSTLSVAAAAPTILLSQLQDVNLGRCLDNTRGAVTEGNLLQWWDCAGVDPERKGLANPNQGFRPDGKKWRYVDNDEYCLAGESFQGNASCPASPSSPMSATSTNPAANADAQSPRTTTSSWRAARATTRATS